MWEINRKHKDNWASKSINFISKRSHVSNFLEQFITK